ncbi:MAG TPA: hypothetical protein VFH17_07165 [Coriobacteriia bacterium]|nr:hypothetical protein [Coriobacteriia bacterium]
MIAALCCPRTGSFADVCRLKAAAGEVTHCEHERCVCWHVVDHLDLTAPMSGAAVELSEQLLPDEKNEG